MNEPRGTFQEEVCTCWMKYEPLWRKWAFKMAHVDYAREDWEQHSYLICIQAMTSYKEESGITFGAYYRMLLYRAGKKLIDKQRLPVAYEEDLQAVQMDQGKSVEECVLDDEMREWVQQLLGECTALERYILIAYYIERRTLKEIAIALDMKYKAVENKKAKVLKRLRNNLT